MSASTVDWESIEAQYPDSEVGIERMAVDMLRNREVIAEMGWPQIDTVTRQHRIGNMISDIAVTHVDGSVTLLEVKRFGLSLRDYCTGVGQLAYQACMAIPQYRTFEVRRVLALPGPVPVDVVLVCEAAGVDILPLPSVQQWRDAIREASCRP